MSINIHYTQIIISQLFLQLNIDTFISFITSLTNAEYVYKLAPTHFTKKRKKEKKISRTKNQNSSSIWLSYLFFV